MYLASILLPMTGASGALETQADSKIALAKIDTNCLSDKVTMFSTLLFGFVKLSLDHRRKDWKWAAAELTDGSRAHRCEA